MGLSVGGEFTTSLLYLTEHSDKEKRGFVGSWGYWEAGMGFLIASLFSALLSKVLNDTELYAWGWRLPFLAGILGLL